MNTKTHAIINLIKDIFSDENEFFSCDICVFFVCSTCFNKIYFYESPKCPQCRKYMFKK